ncbi:MAG: transposase DNA-binding-containing protein [Rhodospirillales bacterium]
MGGGSGSWIDAEVEGCGLGDARLRGRLRQLLGQMGGALGKPIPFACQDWANTKAAYRFFSNDRIGEDQILAGHFMSTGKRVAATPGPILVAHDTTEFTDQHERVGMTYKVNSGRDKAGRIREHTVSGVLMHSSLLLTTGGLPLGLGAAKVWTRSKFKGTAALKRKIKPTRVPIEEKESYRWLENVRQATALCDDPGRCVHVGDREADIDELFCLTRELGTHFLVRTCVDRLAGDGTVTVARVMKDVNRPGFGGGMTQDIRPPPNPGRFTRSKRRGVVWTRWTDSGLDRTGMLMSLWRRVAAVFTLDHDEWAHHSSSIGISSGLSISRI